ncbi:methanol oxidation protein [Methylosinus sp. C49]|jgi:quinoprotein dehydrogenase-associated probable ABC transporter substrate-binding protein|uniref:substrate-binding domain-containing protein n=1 Tax=Methylosinus sp. C49 TaxID=2699395 RepID=UPI0013675EC2|nr:substrate-binding domain-containing protein [Methylosinus sp. C49]BBU61056.1 methanol oxidation protein [Methylosinus sp. C49]
MSRRLTFSLVAVAGLLATAPAQSQSPGLVARPRGAVDDARGSIELIDPKVLRVCADPSNLPFSNSAGEGFENKLAEFLAKKLGKDVAYSYYPGATGFIRNTLNAHLCDVVMGMPQGDDLVQPTNPYYRTSYAVVYRAGSDLEGLTSLADPRLAQNKRIGLVANTPPGNLLARYRLLAEVKPYPLVVDTRVDAPGADMIRDLESGAIDVAILWGPFAGYHVKKSGGRLKLALLSGDKGARMSFRIAMGVRHSDQEWKRELNRIIAQNQGEIDKLLADFGVPLIDESDAPITPAPTASTP